MLKDEHVMVRFKEGSFKNIREGTSGDISIS
jgi:hypothetical protein